MATSNKRIVLLAGWFYPDSVGGTEEYVRLLGKELQVLGCDVKIAAPSKDEKEHDYTYDGLSVYRYPVPLVPARDEVRGVAPPRYLEVFTNWLNKVKPDIVHMHSYTRGCGFFHAQAVKQNGIKLVVTAHIPELICIRGTMMRWGKIQCDGLMDASRCAACFIQKRGVPKPLARLIGVRMRGSLAIRVGQIKQLLNLADHVVAVVGWFYDALLLNAAPRSRLSLCRHGLPAERIVKTTKNNFEFNSSRPLRIGYVGRFNPVKGVHILIESVKRLPSAIPIKLLLYGKTKNEEEAYLKKLKDISVNDNRILFCGEVTNENRQNVFNNLDILAVPSTWLEVGPFVILEAFAAGLPVIGSNLGGIAELVTDGVNGMLVKPDSVKAWCNAFKQVASNKELVEYLTRHIPQVKSSAEVGGEMLRIYERILG